MTTFVQLLQYQAQTRANKVGYTFLTDDEQKENQLTYAQLAQQAKAIAACLQADNAAGKPVLLLYPPGPAYIAAFFGCLYAGAIAVPTYPPRLNRPDPRLESIVKDSQAQFALTTQMILTKIQKRLAHMPLLERLQWRATDALSLSEAEQWHAPVIDGETIAFLQYTSGSTGNPKGVILTHNNLLHNSAIIYDAYGHSGESQGVIWLPPYHDMGLIGGILQPLYGGFPVVLMSPVAFLQRPLRWLEAISHYGGTTSGGPNFAYDLCIRRTTPEQRAALDLSSWQVAFNGAEPIRAETMQRFADAFAPAGFRYHAFYPCYGLAEATLIVSGGEAAAPPKTVAFAAKALLEGEVKPVTNGHMLVSNGHCRQMVQIVNPENGQPCPPEQIGEIWVAGSSVSQGYWQRPEASQETFAGTIVGNDDGPFLRTGDLGFLYQGQLYITGRLKDLIIIRGQNHYPQDIEATAAQSHEALEPDAGAAFSIDVEGEEKLVLVYEVKRSHRREEIDPIANVVRQAITQNHALQLHDFVLIKPRRMPRTSSGKIQRYACRRAYLEGELPVVGQSQLAAQGIEVGDEPRVSLIQRSLTAVDDPAVKRLLLTHYLQEQISHLLAQDSANLDMQTNLTDLGLTPTQRQQLSSILQQDLGYALTTDTIDIGQLVQGILRVK